MRLQSRREFLRRARGFVMASALPLEPTDPDLILFNGNIITIEDRHPRAEAVAIADRRFLAVGSNADVKALATARTNKIAFKIVGMDENIPDPQSGNFDRDPNTRALSGRLAERANEIFGGRRVFEA